MLPGLPSTGPITDQLTAEEKLPVPEMVALNCCVLPGCTFVLAGDNTTDVIVGCGGEVIRRHHSCTEIQED
jgi:hypothetical protein